MVSREQYWASEKLASVTFTTPGHNANTLRKTNQITTMCGKKGGGGKTSGGGKSSGPTPAQVNHGNQLNPSHTQYWASRGLEAPSGACRGEVAKALEQFKSQQKK